MEQNEKESFFVDNFGHYLLNFISDRVKIAGQSNSDKWSLLLHKIEEWKRQYFISSEPVEISGTIVRLRSARCYPMWYIAATDSTVFLISVREII